MRLTALYCVLFVLSAAVMLAITNGVGAAYSVARASAGPAGRAHPAGPSADAAHAAASHQFLLGSLIALGVMAVVSVMLGWMVAGRVLRPLRMMTAATRRISADSLHERLAMPGPGDELKDLADTVDGLLARLESAFAAQRRFVANASHELRTPLATMRASVDVAIAKPGPVPPPVAVLAGRLRGELDKADSLLEGLLTLARAQHGELAGQAAVPLDYAVSVALADRAGAIGARDLIAAYDSGPDGSWVRGSQPLLRRMIDNLLDNAIGHNRPGGWIRVATTVADRRVWLVVENGGAVLDPAQVAGLGQPFRRLGGDRTGPGGAGLGLSIVAAIADAHGGVLRLDARPDGGLRAAVVLPVIRPAPALFPAGLPARAGA